MVEQVASWFYLAKPNPSEQDVYTQIGCHFEEVTEMLNTLGHVDEAAVLLSLAARYKAGKISKPEVFENKTVRHALLDDLCDQSVTATGAACLLGMNFPAALQEVNNSNFSKFENGKPLFDEQGKIMKGKDYFLPDLERFV